MCQFYNISRKSKSRRNPLKKSVLRLTKDKKEVLLFNVYKEGLCPYRKKVSDKNVHIISKCEVFAVKETKLFLFNLIPLLKYKKLLFSGT